MPHASEIRTADPANELPRHTEGEGRKASEDRTSERGRSDDRPSDPDAMREAIQRTRARMSQTLDEIEVQLAREKTVLARRRDELWARATLKGFRRAISREPWRSALIAFVVGYVVAALRD